MALARELSRVFNSHTTDQTMLVVWVSQLIINLRPDRRDPAHNSATLPLFERYLAELFGCSLSDVWHTADQWVDSLVPYFDNKENPFPSTSTCSTFRE